MVSKKVGYLVLFGILSIIVIALISILFFIGGVLSPVCPLPSACSTFSTEFLTEIVNFETIPIIMAILGITMLFFGKIIADIRPTWSDKTTLYAEGLMFSILFIALPFSLSYIANNYFSTCIPCPYDIILLYIILELLYVNNTAHVIFKQKDIEKEVIDAAKNKIEEINLRIASFSEKAVESSLFVYKTINKTVGKRASLFVMAFLTILIDFNLIMAKQNILYFIWSFILSLLVFFMIAISYGFSQAKYPMITVNLKSAPHKVHGKFIKYNKDFLTLKVENRLIDYSRDEILSVEFPIINDDKSSS